MNDWSVRGANVNGPPWDEATRDTIHDDQIYGAASTTTGLGVESVTPEKIEQTVKMLQAFKPATWVLVSPGLRCFAGPDPIVLAARATQSTIERQLGIRVLTNPQAK